MKNLGSIHIVDKIIYDIIDENGIVCILEKF